ncbi:Poly(rC)-binding protein 3 [Coemansia brasiliensis]|uniref:Poly(RC)-binding protein 3 n=1 Tax=Coemansia brasiliensis TaxID=2650707 RepID=A0A9W8IBP7_9FUNG|nr:Poly(rC)-binding protein 3 [Coemansia brasiliensis]
MSTGRHSSRLPARRDSKDCADEGYAKHQAVTKTDKQSSRNAASTETRASGPEPETKQMLRLIFSHEDGGVLIGKNGRHIAKLKESTKASWFISRNTEDGADRLVVLRGSASELANAIYALAQHLSEQATDNRPDDKSVQLPTLHFLFPIKSIGSILGPGGANIAKKRADLDINWLHIFHDAIPFTSERIVETKGTPSALKAVTAWLIQTTMPDLSILQQTAAPYCPVRNGLHKMLVQERQYASSDHRNPINRGGRKRSLSSFEPDTYRPATDSSQDRNKRPRRSSDNSDERSRRRMPTSQSSSKHSNRKEKIVIPDTMAGRIIGRNGTHLALLREKSGARIELSPRVPSMQDRIVTISGHTKQVNDARKLVKDCIRKFENTGA